MSSNVADLYAFLARPLNCPLGSSSSYPQALTTLTESIERRDEDESSMLLGPPAR